MAARRHLAELVDRPFARRRAHGRLTAASQRRGRWRCAAPAVFGATGTVLMAIGALGAGARPVVQDPTFGVRLLNLPSRIQTVSLTMTTTGAVMMALAWLMLGRFAWGAPPDVAQPARPHAAAVGPAAADRATDVQQGRLLLPGTEPDLAVGPGPLPRSAPRPAWASTMCSPCRCPVCGARHPAPYGPLFLWIGRGISALTGENIVAAVLCHRLVVLFGVGLIVWATPRLARRCGVAEVSALWLGRVQPAAVHAPGRRHPQRGPDARADAHRHRVRAARHHQPRVHDAAAPAAGMAAGPRRVGALAPGWPCYSPGPC